MEPPKKDYSTAILERKKAPNRLVVDDAEGGVAVDSSTVALSPGTMDALDVFHGDVVALRGKRRRETVCYAAKDESCPDGLARVNRVVRGNLRLRLGDLVTVTLCAAVKDAARIAISPFEDSVDGISGNLFDAYVKLVQPRQPERRLQWLERLRERMVAGAVRGRVSSCVSGWSGGCTDVPD